MEINTLIKDRNTWLLLVTLLEQLMVFTNPFRPIILNHVNIQTIKVKNVIGQSLHMNFLKLMISLPQHLR